jgi:hypothetical protein
VRIVPGGEGMPRAARSELVDRRPKSFLIHARA